jgi:release factor glutamine methyltransferase
MTTRAGDILSRAGGEFSPIEAGYLLGYTLGRSREFLLAHPEHPLKLGSRIRWEWVKWRRRRGVPAAYITGEKEFYALSFAVNRGTLIPRPETELLVDEVVRRRPGTVLDLGTGSGCIAVSVAVHLSDCLVTATDVSRAALRVARRNAVHHAVSDRIDFLRCSFFDGMHPYGYDVIVSNPPYVRVGDVERLDPGVAAFEPPLALYGGSDGLASYRSILNSGRNFLSSRGVMVLEISPELSAAVQELSWREGWGIEEVKGDLTGAERMLVLAPLQS